MVKKTSLDQLATKADLVKEAKGLRAEFKRTEKNLRQEILRVEERVENLEEGQARIEAKIDGIANTLDGFVGRVDDLTTDNEVGANQIHELREITKNHETRISKLESSN